MKGIMLHAISSSPSITKDFQKIIQFTIISQFETKEVSIYHVNFDYDSQLKATCKSCGENLFTIEIDESNPEKFSKSDWLLSNIYQQLIDHLREGDYRCDASVEFLKNIHAKLKNPLIV